MSWSESLAQSENRESVSPSGWDRDTPREPAAWRNTSQIDMFRVFNWRYVVE